MTGSASRRTLAALLVACAVPALGQMAEVPRIRFKQIAKILPNGDAFLYNEVSLSLQIYTNLRKQITNTRLLLRELGMAGEAAELTDPQVDYDDAHQTITVNATLKGETKNHGRDWFIHIQNPEKFEVADTDPEAITLLIVNQLEVGALLIGTARVEFPPGTTNIRFDAGRGGLLFQMPPPPAASGDRVEAEMTLDAREELMTCLYKVYGNPEFSKLWVARAIFRNTGDAVLEDFRVRFRIPDYSSWGPWQKSAKVYPTQTVVEAFYPILSHTIRELKSATPALVEVAWSYRRPDGKLVEDTDSRRTTLLGLNDVICSSMPAGECTTWFELFNNSPLIAATFVSHADPVVQRFAGMAANLAGGAGASLSNQNALRFMKAVYDLMCANKLTYQSPPGLLKEGVRQHVKFSRDVLRNRAGTCIDLAILYASTCQAGGLQPCLVFLPGHVFPVIKLPEGNIYQPVEATCVSGGPNGQKVPFASAAQIGEKEMAQCIQSGVFILVDIQTLRKLGVPTPELPDLPPSTLNDWGITVPTAEEIAKADGGNVNVQDAGGGMKRARDPGGVYTVDVPQDWTVQQQGGGLMANKPGMEASMMVAAVPKRFQSVEQYAQQMAANWKQQVAGWTQVSQSEIQVSGRKGIYIRATGTPGGMEMQADYFLVLTDTHQLLMTFMAMKGDFAKFQPAFRKIFASWAIQ